MNEELQRRVDQLLLALRKNYVEFSNKSSRYYGFESPVHRLDFEIVPGKKYAKIVQVSRQNNPPRPGDSSVHAFVDMATGSLLKAASWKAPAKGVRYFLLDDVSFARCLERADWAGSYLYQR
jgi:hypothetical protein